MKLSLAASSLYRRTLLLFEGIYWDVVVFSLDFEGKIH